MRPCLSPRPPTLAAPPENTESVYEVFLRKLISAQIRQNVLHESTPAEMRQLVLYIGNNKA